MGSASRRYWALVACLCAGQLAAAVSVARAQTTETPAAGAQPAAPTQKLDILAYDIEGNSVLQAIDVETAVYPFLGEGKTVADVDGARDALERAYHSRGYQTVQIEIPQQTGEGGIIRLKVVEGRIDRLRVVNAKYFLPSDIKALAPSLAEGKVPNIPEVQKDIVNLNQLPDRKVTPALRAGKRPGTLEVDLQVEDQAPLHATVELNNRKSQSTSDLRTSATISYDNLWQLGHSVSMSYQVAPQNRKDAEVFAGSYLARFAGTPYSLQISGVKTNSNVSTLGGTDVIGNGDIIGIRGAIALPGTATFGHSVSIGVDYKRFIEDVRLGGDASTTPITYFPFSVAYNASQQEAEAVNFGNVGLTFTYPAFGSSTPNFENKRFSANPQFFYLRGGLGRTQSLPFDLTALFELEGQVATDPLVSNEQFSAGGATSVRGYDEAVALGDYGVRGTIELRSPSFAERIDPAIDDLRFVAFFDAATLGTRTPLPGQSSSAQLMGTGVGLRFKALGHFTINLDLAVALRHAGDTRTGDPRVNFRLISEY